MDQPGTRPMATGMKGSETRANETRANAMKDSDAMAGNGVMAASPRVMK